MDQRLQRLLAAAAIAIALCPPAPRAAATLLQSCCACVDSQVAQTSGRADTDVRVFFCAEAGAGDVPGLEQRCDAVSNGMGTLHCEANIPGPSCQQQLADAGLLCPVAGAPVASPLHLFALGAALALGGTAALQRRRRRAP